MNAAEQIVRQRYSGEGWDVFHQGAPDFLLRKRERDGTVRFAFSEVKIQGQRLRPAQTVWREALESLGADYRIDNGHGTQEASARIPVKPSTLAALAELCGKRQTYDTLLHDMISVYRVEHGRDQ